MKSRAHYAQIEKLVTSIDCVSIHLNWSVECYKIALAYYCIAITFDGNYLLSELLRLTYLS